MKWSKNFHSHKKKVRASGECLQKNKDKQVSSGLLSHLHPSLTRTMATRASILVTPQFPGIFENLGLRPG